MGAQLGQFLSDNIVTLILPLISALAVWIFSRRRQESEIEKNDAEIEKIEAEKTHLVAETESIATETANKVLLMYAELDNQRKREYDVLKDKLSTLERNQTQTQRMLQVYIEVVNYLLTEMDNYNPEIAIAAREKLKKGLQNG